jgi:hypothetical protein
MSIFELFAAIVFLGFVAWGVQKIVPMSPPFQNGFYVLCVILVVLLFLAFFGIGPNIRLWPESWGHGRR